MTEAFNKLGLKDAVLLAPLAGVSDIPFRRVCQRLGSDLTYVEMLSATALCYGSKKTFDMLKRHQDEPVLGVQVTANNALEMGKAVAILDDHNFETIDINMGCPVKKVVKVGCGSALLKSPKLVFDVTSAARKATQKPLSVKIRLGWDHNSYTYLEVGKAAEEAGADWLVVHGRTRSDDYGVPVDLEKIAELKRALSIPVVGNGNILSHEDAVMMREATGVDALMVSRGALGNPWIFKEIKDRDHKTSGESWRDTVVEHFLWQRQMYGDNAGAVVRMRKHLLWYAKGWPGARSLRDQIVRVHNVAEATKLIEEFANELDSSEVPFRQPPYGSHLHHDRFQWDPKWDMDRKLDRGFDDISDHPAIN